MIYYIFQIGRIVVAGEFYYDIDAWDSREFSVFRFIQDPLRLSGSWNHRGVDMSESKCRQIVKLILQIPCVMTVHCMFLRKKTVSRNKRGEVQFREDSRRLCSEVKTCLIYKGTTPTYLLTHPNKTDPLVT